MVMHVLQTIKELSEEVATHGLFKSTAKGDEIEELTATDELKDDVVYHLAGILFLVDL